MNIDLCINNSSAIGCYDGKVVLNTGTMQELVGEFSYIYNGGGGVHLGHDCF